MGGGISKIAKQELLATIRDRYRASSKRETSRILDEFIPELTSGGDRPPSQTWHQAAGAVRQRSGAAAGEKGLEGVDHKPYAFGNCSHCGRVIIGWSAYRWSILVGEPCPRCGQP